MKLDELGHTSCHSLQAVGSANYALRVSKVSVVGHGEWLPHQFHPPILSTVEVTRRFGSGRMHMIEQFSEHVTLFGSWKTPDEQTTAMQVTFRLRVQRLHFHAPGSFDYLTSSAVGNSMAR